MSAKLFAKGQSCQNFKYSALLPKFADVNSWWGEPWHLNRRVRCFQKVMFIIENSDANVRKESSKVGPRNLALNMKAFAKLHTWIFQKLKGDSSLSVQNEKQFLGVWNYTSYSEYRHDVRIEKVAAVWNSVLSKCVSSTWKEQSKDLIE